MKHIITRTLHYRSLTYTKHHLDNLMVCTCGQLLYGHDHLTLEPELNAGQHSPFWVTIVRQHPFKK